MSVEGLSNTSRTPPERGSNGTRRPVECLPDLPRTKVGAEWETSRREVERMSEPSRKAVEHSRGIYSSISTKIAPLPPVIGIQVPALAALMKPPEPVALARKLSGGISPDIFVGIYSKATKKSSFK